MKPRHTHVTYRSCSAARSQIGPGLARLFYYSTFAVRFGALLVFVLGLVVSFQNRDGQWSLVQTPENNIPMNMHGGVVFLSARQKFIYYDAFGYCGLLAVALGSLLWPMGWLWKANNIPSCVLGTITGILALGYATAVVVANLGPDVTRLHLPWILP